ncbi:hypothetical protein ACH5RR_034935 [Cinchona calisaya]|uniref:Uncharacterized protein n=1 Tax=Cinchona calisaya TaxID=153742 RepID=A0ABD2YCC6_9GENT
MLAKNTLLSTLYTVRIQQSSRQMGLFQKLVILVLLSLLAYGGKNRMVVGMNKKLTLVLQEKQHKVQHLQQQEDQEQKKKHSFDHDLFSSSKRRVPNASDPLHNR